MKRSVKVMMAMATLFAALLCSTEAGFAAPVDESGISKTVDMMAVQGEMAYFSLKEGFLQPQMYNVCYFDLTTNAGRIAYSTLLAFKTADLKITRIVYDTVADGTCRVLLLQTQ